VNLRSCSHSTAWVICSHFRHIFRGYDHQPALRLTGGECGYRRLMWSKCSRRSNASRDEGEPSSANGYETSGETLGELVERARAGDDQAWAGLFHRSYDKLLAYSSRRLACRDQAQDAVGETMARAVGNIDRFRNDGAGFDAWMYGIARHVVIDAQRKQWREGPGYVPDGADTAPEPLDRAVEVEDSAEVRVAFGNLSRADQELLELRVVSGLSAEETASVLGRRPGAVRMAQSRALDRLREEIRDEARAQSRASRGSAA
jgi:RNA polymerase sigma-70 factor, ECF subfamily